MQPSVTHIRHEPDQLRQQSASGRDGLHTGSRQEVDTAQRSSFRQHSWLREGSKRALDICGSIFGLLLFSPVLLATIIAVKLTSPGPVFYSQTRLGRKGRMFRIWKIRTMYINADQLLQKMLANDPETRELWERERKLRSDPRVTTIGQFLRRFSLDEVPQFWNVLMGDMSLVGPRPIQKSEMTIYARRFFAYCSVKPGLTGLWQVSGRSDTTYEERITLDERYSRTWSVSLDLLIMLRTFSVVFKGSGAY